MTRLIDADEFFENYPELAIEPYINAPTVCGNNPKWCESCVSKGKCASTRPQGEWIPVSERLPDDMQKVLIWFEYLRYGDFNCMYQTYGFGYVCDGKWSPFINGKTGWQDCNIIAWQPLPEPYKKGGADMRKGCAE